MTFTHQKWNKQQSEQRIFNYLSDGDRRFSDLLELTGLSKSVLSERLDNLTKQGKIELVPDQRIKRFLYHLIYDSLDDLEKVLVMLHGVSNYIVRYLEKLAEDSAISDKEYANRLMEGVLTLFNFRMLKHSVTPRPIQEEWLKTTLGLEFVKKMPRLLPENRNIFPYILDGMSPKEQALYKSKETKEAANRLLEYLNMIVKKIPKPDQK